MKKPLLSVCLITYNQAKYIKGAIDSILAQETDFIWELIIADDFSTDGTREILLEYKKKYPDTIKLILQKENVGAERNWLDLINLPRTKYIAYLEGDDFWTDRKKLSLQVNFLEKFPEHNLVFHPTKIFYENSKTAPVIWPKMTGGRRKKINVNELLKSNFIPSNSVVYRRQDYGNIPKGIIPGDWYFHLLHSKNGEIGFINKTMSAYRRHNEGIWWESQGDISKIWRKHGIGHIKLYAAMLELYGDNVKFREIIVNHIYKMVDNILMLDDANTIKEELLNEFPDFIHDYLLHSKEDLVDRNTLRIKLETEIHNKNLEIIRLSHELGLIKGSKTWRIRNKLARVIGKEKV